MINLYAFLLLKIVRKNLYCIDYKIYICMEIV